MCEQCKRVYRSTSLETCSIPDFCHCGARLSPDPKSSSTEFSARAICPECYEQRMRQTFDPTPAPEPASGPHPALSGPHKIPAETAQEVPQGART